MKVLVFDESFPDLAKSSRWELCKNRRDNIIQTEIGLERSSLVESSIIPSRSGLSTGGCSLLDDDVLRREGCEDAMLLHLHPLGV